MRNARFFSIVAGTGLALAGCADPGNEDSLQLCRFDTQVAPGLERPVDRSVVIRRSGGAAEVDAGDRGAVPATIHELPDGGFEARLDTGPGPQTIAVTPDGQALWRIGDGTGATKTLAGRCDAPKGT